MSTNEVGRAVDEGTLDDLRQKFGKGLDCLPFL